MNEYENFLVYVGRLDEADCLECAIKIHRDLVPHKYGEFNKADWILPFLPLHVKSNGRKVFKIERIFEIATTEAVITKQHAQSLAELVKWFKVVIQKRAESNAPLTLEYCDELLEALEPERSSNERSRS